MQKIREFIQKNWALLCLALLYTIWAFVFIYQSSYVASDGRLYFALFDDAMISMRYAWNFAHGQGLVWNSGEYVEGYTNLLMTLLMSLASFLFQKRYAVLVIQLAGVFFMLGTAWIAAEIFKAQKPSNSPAKYILFATILLYYPLNYWSLMGMETGLLAFLLCLGLFCSLQYEEKLEAKYFWTAVISFGLAYLTRNDSLIFAAPVFLYLIQTFKAGRKFIYLCLAGGLIYMLFPIGQTIFRYFYYGDLVPNTYTLKLGGIPLDIRLIEGWIFVKRFLQETAFILFMALIGLLLKPSKQNFLLFSLFLLSIGYEIYVGGDPWTYWRIMAPTMPFVFLLAVSAFDDISRKISAKFPFIPQPVLLLAACLAGIYMVNSRFIKQMVFTELAYDVWDARRHIELSIFINRVTYENATVGVFWAGTLPYYVDRKAIDFLGKSDSYISHLPADLPSNTSGSALPPGHNKYDLTYSIQTLLPTYVEGFEWGDQNLVEWRDEYYVKTTNKYVELYLLKDSPDVNWDEVKVKGK
jgi:hypothetical protein